MTFKENYTTDRLINADTSGIEAKKIKITEETYLNAKMIEDLTEKIQQLRFKE